MEVCALFKSVAPYRLEEVESCLQRPWDFQSVLQLLVTCCDLLALSRGAVEPACLLLWDAVKNGKYKGAS